MLTLELPPHKTQTAFNLRRWAELLADRELAKVEGRIETDRHGHIIRQTGLALRPERCDELSQSGRDSADARLKDASPVPQAS
jgi:hypothetical protein